MRKSILLAVALTSSIASAQGKDLGPNDVRAELKGIDTAIGQCYVDAVGEGAGGTLDVMLVIHRKGIIDAIDVRAPGVGAKAFAKIDACVRAQLDGFVFPARKVGVTAVLPYVWQKTTAAGAGPQESCWDAKGCKTTDDDATAAQPKKQKSITNRQARRAPRG